MEITTPISTLIVDEETIIPLSLTNPLFEQQGSHSLPFSVPYNRHNLWALNLPYTPQKSTKSGQTISATLVAYPLNETGEITVQTVTVDDRIELSFTTREGMFYAWANKTRLRELEFDVVEFKPGNPVYYQVLNSANQPYPQSKWAVFPIVVTGNREKVETQSTPNDAVNYEYFRFFNLPDLAHGGAGTFLREGPSLENFSPFLYVMYVLDTIITQSGHYIKENELTNIDELKRLCILNPVSFAINGNKLDPAELVPDMSAMDFIDAVLNKFNAYTIINHKTREISIKLKDITLSTSAGKNLLGDLNISNFNHKTLRITHDTINDDLAKTANLPLDEIAEKFDLGWSPTSARHDPDTFQGIPYQFTTSNVNQNLYIYFFLSSQYAYWQRLRENPDPGDEYLVEMLPLGCQAEQYEPEGEDVLDVKSKAALHGMLVTFARYLYFWSHSPTSDIFAYENRALMFCPAFRVGIIEPLSSFTDKIEDNDFPLCFSIYRGETSVVWSKTTGIPYTLSTKKQPFGSCFPYDRAGNLLKDSTQEDVYPDTLSLQVMGEHGLRENFFKVTEEFYKHSGLRADVVHFNPAQVINHNMDEKVTIDGTECFLTQVNVEVSLNGLWVTGVQAITAKPLLD